MSFTTLDSIISLIPFCLYGCVLGSKGSWYDIQFSPLLQHGVGRGFQFFGFGHTGSEFFNLVQQVFNGYGCRRIVSMQVF